jgi:GNAT superfamily N-acetyltransferase
MDRARHVLVCSRAEDHVPLNIQSFDVVTDAVDARVISIDGIPVALTCLSAVEGADNTAHIRVVTTDDARGHGIAYLRACRKILNEWVTKYSYRMFVTFTLFDSVENRRWMKFFGFVEMQGPHSVYIDKDGVVWKGYFRWV